MHDDDRRELEELDLRLRVLLPETYQDSYECLEPKPMGSAGLKYGPDGKVAWDEIWGSFCDLAMAGGPPHKGTLLEPGSREAINAAPDALRRSRRRDLPRHHARDRVARARIDACRLGQRRLLQRDDGVVAAARDRDGERCGAEPRPRAVTAGGAAFPTRQGNQERRHRHRQDDALLDGAHAARAEERDRGLFAKMSLSSPLIEPGLIERGGPAHRSLGEVGGAASSASTVKAAVWMMRAMVVNNVLSRREGTTLFVPNNPASDPGGVIVARTVMMVHRLAAI